MSRQAALMVVGFSVVLVILLGVWLLGSGGKATDEGTSQDAVEGTDAGAEDASNDASPGASEDGEGGSTVAADGGSAEDGDGPHWELFFPGYGKRLYAERRPIPALVEGETPPDLRDRVRGIVEALLEGPRSAGRVAPLPPGVTLATVYLGTGGVVYLDFQAPEGAPPPATGSMAELLTIYSVVNSVARNVPEVRAVVLLWNGNQRFTLSGHVDTSRPLLPNPQLLAR